MRDLKISDGKMLVIGFVLMVIGSFALNKTGIIGALVWLAGLLIVAISLMRLVAGKVAKK